MTEVCSVYQASDSNLYVPVNSWFSLMGMALKYSCAVWFGLFF